jgi:hypothetical protein
MMYTISKTKSKNEGKSGVYFLIHPVELMVAVEAADREVFGSVPFNDTKMKTFLIVFSLSWISLISCSKNDHSVSDPVVGTWVFTNRVTNSFAYPSVLTNPFPIGSSSWSISSDSIQISFDNDGNYTFLNFNLPVDKGSYILAQDSFLIIKPVSSDFIKFNYSLSSVGFSSGTNPAPVPPYNDFRFSSDTIVMKKPTDNNITFSALWLTKAQNPIIPSNDTLILNYCLSNFKRQ